MPLTFPPNSTINLEIRRTGNSPPPTWWQETPKVIYQTTKPSIQILLEIRLNLGKWGIAAVSTKFGCVGFNVIHETKRHRENSRSTYRVQNLTTQTKPSLRVTPHTHKHTNPPLRGQRPTSVTAHAQQVWNKHRRRTGSMAQTHKDLYLSSYVFQLQCLECITLQVLCVHMCSYIYVHREARGQPQLSRIKCEAPFTQLT